MPTTTTSDWSKVAVAGFISVGKTHWHWAVRLGTSLRHGDSVDELANVLAGHIRAGTPVAFGLCAPVFLPWPNDTVGFEHKRPDERSAGPRHGLIRVLEVPFVFSHLRDVLPTDLDVRFDESALDLDNPGIMVWEARKVQTSINRGLDSGPISMVDEFAFRLMNGTLPERPTSGRWYNLAAASFAGLWMTLDPEAIFEPVLYLDVTPIRRDQIGFMTDATTNRLSYWPSEEVWRWRTPSRDGVWIFDPQLRRGVILPQSEAKNEMMKATAQLLSRSPDDPQFGDLAPPWETDGLAVPRALILNGRAEMERS